MKAIVYSKYGPSEVLLADPGGGNYCTPIAQYTNPNPGRNSN